MVRKTSCSASKAKSQCLLLCSPTPQEEGEDDLMFKMVFVVNMDLAMGVGKVRLVVWFVLCPEKKNLMSTFKSLSLHMFF